MFSFFTIKEWISVGIFEYERHKKGRIGENQGMAYDFIRNNKTVEVFPRNHKGHDVILDDRISRLKWGVDFDKRVCGIQDRQFQTDQIAKKFQKKMPKKEKEIYRESDKADLFLRHKGT